LSTEVIFGLSNYTFHEQKRKENLLLGMDAVNRYSITSREGAQAEWAAVMLVKASLLPNGGIRQPGRAIECHLCSAEVPAISVHCKV
jgi:hypothetical protein